MESYKHACAKQVVADWLRGLPEDSRLIEDASYYCRERVYLEYPICDESSRYQGWAPPWDESPLDPTMGCIVGGQRSIPSYELCVASGLVPHFIFDVATLCKGQIHHAFEIVHRHQVTAQKLDRIHEIAKLCGLHLYVLDAEWVLNQLKPPTRLRARKYTW